MVSGSNWSTSGTRAALARSGPTIHYKLRPFRGLQRDEVLEEHTKPIVSVTYDAATGEEAIDHPVKLAVCAYQGGWHCIRIVQDIKTSIWPHASSVQY